MFLPDGSASAKTHGIKPFCLSLYLLFNQTIITRKRPGTHCQTTSGRRVSLGRAGVDGTGKLVLPGRQSRAAGTPQAPDTAQLLARVGAGSQRDF